MIMKRLLSILLLFIGFNTWAQFPAPSNLKFSYDYIMIGESGYCNDGFIYGASYCSHFSWATPDTISINSTLINYNIYYNSNFSNDTIILATTTDTTLHIEYGIMGKVWVTAQYSNPDGESIPSNKIVNNDLPISVKQVSHKEIKISVDLECQEITIKNEENISMINLYNEQGKLIKSQKGEFENISIENLLNGLYIIEILNQNMVLKRQKIII